MKKTIISIALVILVFALCSITAFAEETTIPDTESATIETATEKASTEAETPTDVTEPTSSDIVEVIGLTENDTTEQSIPIEDVVITIPNDENDRIDDVENDSTTLNNAVIESDGSEIPKTGDNGILAAAVVTLLLASGVVILLVKRKKKVTD